MEVINASSDHVEYISNGLVSHFSKVNQFFTYPRYKDDYETMYKHVTKRIVDGDENHHYFVAIEDGKPLGFLNFYMNDDNVGTIIAIYGDSSNVKKGLVERAIEFAKERDVAGLECELFSYEDDIMDFIKEYPIENQLIHFKINI